MKNDLAPHLKMGARGEDFAADYLASRGFRILARNWRHGRLELDIICREKDCIVFVEVKTRANADFGGPEAAITPAKKASLVKCAFFWLQKNRALDSPVRFDILCLVASGKTFHVEHYRNALEFSPALGNCHAYWQPW